MPALGFLWGQSISLQPGTVSTIIEEEAFMKKAMFIKQKSVLMNHVMKIGMIASK